MQTPFLSILCRIFDDATGIGGQMSLKWREGIKSGRRRNCCWTSASKENKKGKKLVFVRREEEEEKDATNLHAVSGIKMPIWFFSEPNYADLAL